MESYILTRSMHLGYLKETFGRGALIQFNPETRKVIIDGRRFDDYRDVEILKRQAIKNPHDPFIIQYSEEALQDMLGESMEPEPAVPQRVPNNEGMPIVQSDEDSHDTIDISHTKVSKINQQKREADRNRTKNQDLPIVKGDESVEERIAALKEAKTTDIAARAERVRLMAGRKAEMPIVHDDSLGHASGSSSSALNAGTPVGGRRAEETPENIKAAAEARKTEVEMNRQRAADEMGIDLDQAEIDEVVPMPAAADASSEGLAEEVAESDKDSEIAALKARLAELEGTSPDETQEAPLAAPKKAKRPVVSKEG